MRKGELSLIPLELKLKNFMSYGDRVEPISFASFHLACLTGDNGNGKSALLDAMTWALWGQARGVDKNGAGMDDLVKLGQEDMEVEFTFQLEKDTYRIFRKRDKKRGVSLLELQLKDGDKYRTISENKISETQGQIIQVLKMDYETFINSAFVLQGKADTFTQQKPNDRKRILGEILGLNYYEQLEIKARKKAYQYEQQAVSIASQLEVLKEETKEKDSLKLHYEDTKRKLKLQVEKIKAKELEYQSLLEAKQDYEEALLKANQLKTRIIKDKEEVQRIEKMVLMSKEKISKGRLLLQKEKEIVEGYNNYVKYLQLKEDYIKKQEDYFKTKENINMLESFIQNQEKIYSLKLEHVRQQIKELEKQIESKLDLNRKCQELQKQLGKAESFKELKESKENKLKELETELSIKEMRIQDLNAKVDELRSNYQKLKKSPKCPTCSKDLTTEESKGQVLAVLAKEGKDANSSLNSLKEDRLAIINSIKVLKQEILDLGQKLQDNERLFKEFTVMEQKVAIIKERESKLSTKAQEEKELLAEIETKNYILEEKTKLVQALSRLDSINYDETVFKEILKKVDQLQSYVDKQNHLMVTKDSLSDQEKNLAHFEGELEHKNQSIKEDEGYYKILLKRSEELSQVIKDLEILTKGIKELKRELSELETRLGAIEERYNRCINLYKEKLNKEKDLGVVLSEKNYYTELTQAFGKKGIQAIIIENAIPELQEEANQLLNRMTDGRLNVALITQKGNKKGNVIETLDIQISDELGTRKYELYSGGEAFRVNFALRIALSKLLAKRAGARLETLIIDEGFGTQDGKGKERLIELITSIQEEFAKIIVITHIQELKDAFPVHIEIQKGKDGSKVTII